MKLLIIPFIIGPVLFFYAVAWLLKHPGDYTGPLAIASAGLVLTLVSRYFGKKFLRRIEDKNTRYMLLGAMYGGLIGGLAIGIMLYFLV